MTASVKRKGAGPRKAVRQTNGQSPASQELAPPERFDAPAVAPSVMPEHPYGDVRVFVFTPAKVKPGDSLDPIIFPHISTLEADVEFFWELDSLDPMHQAFRYMQKAGVPRDIQRRVVRLPDDELGRFLSSWFSGVLLPQGVSPPGES